MFLIVLKKTQVMLDYYLLELMLGIPQKRKPETIYAMEKLLQFRGEELQMLSILTAFLSLLIIE